MTAPQREELTQATLQVYKVEDTKKISDEKLGKEVFTLNITYKNGSYDISLEEKPNSQQISEVHEAKNISWYPPKKVGIDLNQIALSWLFFKSEKADINEKDVRYIAKNITNNQYYECQRHIGESCIFFPINKSTTSKGKAYYQGSRGGELGFVEAKALCKQWFEKEEEAHQEVHAPPPIIRTEKRKETKKDSSETPPQTNLLVTEVSSYQWLMRVTATTGGLSLAAAGGFGIAVAFVGLKATIAATGGIVSLSLFCLPLFALVAGSTFTVSAIGFGYGFFKQKQEDWNNNPRNNFGFT